MKNLTLLLILIVTICNSQTIKGTIILNPLRGIGDSSELSEKAKEPIYLSYIYSNKISKQEMISKGGITIETILENKEDLNDLPYEREEITIQPNISIHYKNHNTNIYRYEGEKTDQNAMKTNISIKDSIPVYEWKLVDETQTVAGYLCKKATTTKNIGRTQIITAWYCEDIPINDGPFDFSGLPGLILQIEIDDISIKKFQTLEFYNELDTVIETPINKTHMLTMSEYLKSK